MLQFLFFFIPTTALLWKVATSFLTLISIHAVPSGGTATRIFAITFCLSAAVFVIILYERIGLFSDAEGAVGLSLTIVALLMWVTLGLPVFAVRSLLGQRNPMSSSHHIPVTPTTQNTSPASALSIGLSTVFRFVIGGILHIFRFVIGGSILHFIVAVGIVALVWAGAAFVLAPCTSKAASAEQPSGGDCETLFANIMSRAGLIGVIFVAALGGYAAVATPLSYLAPFLAAAGWSGFSFSGGGRVRADRVMEALSRRQRHVINTWGERSRKLAKAEQQLFARKRGGGGGESSDATTANSSTQPAAASSSMFGKLTTAIWDRASGTTSIEKQAETLRIECQGYEAVSVDVFLEMEEASEAHQMITSIRSSWWRGPLYFIYGAVLTFYCVVKVSVTTWSFLFGNFSYTDPVTVTLTTCVQYVPWLPNLLLGPDPHSTIFQISFVFNTLIIISAVRGFLILVFRLTSHSQGGISAEASLIFFAEAMGLYFLGLSLMLRKSLPAGHRASLEEAVGGSNMPVAVFHRTHDGFLILFVLGTAVVLRYMRSNEGDIVED